MCLQRYTFYILSTCMANSSTKTLTRKAPVTTDDENDLEPASCGLPKDVHAKIVASAAANERTFAAELRKIAKDWAAKQPAN